MAFYPKKCPLIARRTEINQYTNLSNPSNLSNLSNPESGLLAPLVIPEGWRYNQIESTAAPQLLAFLFLVLRSSGAWLGLKIKKPRFAGLSIWL